MSLSLAEATEKKIADYVTTGVYESADDVVLEGLRLIEEQRQKRLQELRQKIEMGHNQITEGKVTDGEVVFQRLFDEIKQKQ